MSRTKPWEETNWFERGGRLLRTLRAPEDSMDAFFGFEPDSVARARLASAAPEMARVLLKVREDRKTGVCVDCGQSPCWDRCELDAALRKAGVSE